MVKSAKKNICQIKEDRESAGFGGMTLCNLGYSRRTSLVMGYLRRNGKHSTAAPSRRGSSMFKELLGGQQGFGEKWARETIRKWVGSRRWKMSDLGGRDGKEVGRLYWVFGRTLAFILSETGRQKAFKQKSNMSRLLKLITFSSLHLVESGAAAQKTDKHRTWGIYSNNPGESKWRPLPEDNCRNSGK